MKNIAECIESLLRSIPATEQPDLKITVLLDSEKEVQETANKIINDIREHYDEQIATSLSVSEQPDEIEIEFGCIKIVLYPL